MHSIYRRRDSAVETVKLAREEGRLGDLSTPMISPLFLFHISASVAFSLRFPRFFTGDTMTTGRLGDPCRRPVLSVPWLRRFLDGEFASDIGWHYLTSVVRPKLGRKRQRWSKFYELYIYLEKDLLWVSKVGMEHDCMRTPLKPNFLCRVHQQILTLLDNTYDSQTSIIST